MKKYYLSPPHLGRGWKRIFLIMKMTLFLVVIFCQQAFARQAYSQMDKISLKVTNLSMVEVFELIEQQTTKSFMYKDDDVVTHQSLNIDIQDQLLDDVLQLLLNDVGLEYEIKEDLILIKPYNSSNNQQQEITVKGKVLDYKGEPIVGANVILLPYNKGTVTDTNGEFLLKVNSSTGKLKISCIGFKHKEVEFVINQELIVVMEEEIAGLDEVTVVAYGTQKSQEVTGSISSLKGAELRDVPTANVNNLLQGRVAGMSVVNSSGSPGGGGTSIVIRGFNSLSVEAERRGSDPLWVIDGVPVQSFTSPVTGTNALADIDPNDIESIEVLKDASSASMYGSRAANGVILVTTKKGKEESAKLSLNFSQSFGFKPTMLDVTGGVAERRYHVAQLEGLRTAYRYKNDEGYYEYKNPEGYIDSYNNSAQYDLWWNKGYGHDDVALQDSLNPFYNNSTNWFDLYMQASRTSAINLSVSGGNKQIKYNLGMGYYDETGVLARTNFNRVNMLANFQINPVKNLDMDLRMYVARTDRGRANQNDALGIEMMTTDPFELSTTLPGVNSAVYNEAKKLTEGVKDDNIGYRLRGSYNIAYEIFKGLRLSSSIALDYQQAENYYFGPSIIYSDLRSRVSNEIDKRSMMLNENLLSYKFEIGSNRFDALLGSSYQYDTRIYIGGGARGGSSDQIQWAVNFPELVYNNDVAEAGQAFSSYKIEKALLGYFGRINYVLNNKYLASVTLRRDGSSTFGEDNQWGYFPSGSVGWILSREAFMGNISAIDFLKFRGSFGKTGLHFSQPYLALGVFSPSTFSFLGRSAVEPEWEEGLYNPQLAWEETEQLDLGFDLQMLNNKLDVTFDYYHRHTTNLLSQIVLPSAGNYTGYKTQWQNAYSIYNQGVELMVKTNIINKPDFFWDLTFNIARNWNKFGGGGDGRDFLNGSNNINIVGKSMNQLYLYQQDGFYQTDEEVPVYDYIKEGYSYTQYGSGNKYNIYSAGDPKYLDLNGDGEITAEDKVYAGSPLPLAYGGIINQITWKNWDFNCLFNYSLGAHLLNAAIGQGLSIDVNTATGEAHTLHPVLVDLSQYNFWSYAGDDADVARVQADAGKKVYSMYTSNMVEQVNYIKLKSIVLGYTFKKITKKSNMSARVFASGENLFTITNYSGRDPEAVDPVTGIDRADTYPLIRKVTVGFSLNF